MRLRSTRVVAGLMVLLAVLCGGSAASAARPVDHGVPTLPLGHAGRWLTDSAGRVVVLHGTNMVYKLAPYYPAAAGFGDSDAAFLARIGFTAVRVGVLWEALEPQPGVYDDAYLNQIAATVQTLARHGVVSLLDFHQDQYNEVFAGEGFPSWAVQDDGLPNTKTPFPTGYENNTAVQRAFENFWADKAGPGGVGLQERYAAAWVHVARRFAGNPYVLGYEVMNEPFPGSDYLLCVAAAGCSASDAQLTGLEHKVDHAIRSVDKRTLVFYEPYVTFNFGFQDHVGALGDPRAVFAWHNYCLTGTTCGANATDFKNAAAHIAPAGEAEFLTEFGATTEGAELDTIVALADQNMVPWAEWAYCTCGDPTGSPVEGIVNNPRQPKTGSNLVGGTLTALVEPYPYVVAGTPRSWSYARASRTFRLSYSTRAVSGRHRFPLGSITAIETPAFDYPSGYSVRARGGAIVSPRGAPVLRIASCRRAAAVTVTVAPGTRRSESCRR